MGVFFYAHIGGGLFGVVAAAMGYLFGCAIFFVVYKFTFAHFWNLRARRLRNSQALSEAVG